VTLVAMAVTISIGVALSGSDGATEGHVPDAQDH
jgi:hypothetical protein